MLYLSALAASPLWFAAPRRAGADYSAANSYTLEPAGFTDTYANGSAGVQQAGYGHVGGLFHGLLWNDTAASAIDINPSGFSESYIFGSSLLQQVGAGYGLNTAYTNHALLWSGSAASAVDLGPDGFHGSFAMATNGTQQIGWGTSSTYYNHAVLWSGTAASAVDLNPAAYYESWGNAISGNQQVGYAKLVEPIGNQSQYVAHALLWTGTAESAVDLNPDGFSETYGYATNGTQQFGSGYGPATGNALHALLWNSSATSYVDLHPALYDSSQINAANDSQYVGVATTNGKKQHAMLWNGSSGTYTDLNSMLGPLMTASYAQSIDAYGNITGVGYFGNVQKAVEWLAGDTYITATATGTWNAAANWLAGVPANGNDVLILATDTLTHSITYTNANPAIVLGKLTLDGNGGGTIALSQAQDALNTTTEFVGFIGNAAYTQSGGTHAVSGVLTLGAKSGSSGAYNLAGGSLTVSTLNVGSAGVGSLLVSPGASFLVSSAMNISAGSTATFASSQVTSTGATITNHGTLQIGAGGTCGTLGTASIINNAALVLNRSDSIILNNAITGSGGLTHAGSGTTTLAGPYAATGPIAVNAGKLIFASTNAPRQTPAVLLKMDGLSIASSTTLDVSNHDLMIGNASLATIENQILRGFNKTGGPGDPALTSSAALSNGNLFLVPIDADALLGNGIPGSAIGHIFDGLAISQPGTILVKYAYIGDVNLDGQINGLDYATAAGHVGEITPGLSNIQSAWLCGDVNFDGIVNSQDFDLMSSNASLSQLSPLGALNLSAGVPVPEPSSLALLAGSTLLLFRRRRVRRR